MFRIGQKVVCIADFSWARRYPIQNIPALNGIYTVRDINNEAGGIHLFEITNAPTSLVDDQGSRSVGEPYFWTAKFRPVIERDTSIEIFTRMLNPSRENMDA